MPRIIRAPAAGFCSGVNRALRLAEEALSRTAGEERVYALGPLVHNQAVIQRLESKGLKTVESLNEIPPSEDKVRLVIRSHGAGPEILAEALRRGYEVIDGTCPLVKRVQRLVEQLRQEGYKIVILGESEHPEVVGIKAWSGEEALVVRDADEAEAVRDFKRLGLVAQTTQPLEKYQQVGSLLIKKAGELRAFNTVCSASRERQAAARELANQVDLMIVVGSRFSANTAQLVRVCSSTGTPTYLVEEAAQVELDWLGGVEKLGVTAGASTPEWIIEEVINRMSEMERERELAAVGNEAENSEGEEKTSEGLAASEEMVNQEMMEAQMTKDMPDLRPGSVISGKVVQVKDDEVLVDVGGKSEGVIPLRELS
ncbi:MAG: 4-hydroxy-3-methylbut-2-enyl diphosphate reductase, partial [Syntrophomonadaceae bacterium]|nr:4-hydroxy-3-methylbut-2-enyl diphosphate reductase [Syntrophomonadaceae bacterium]